MMRGLSTLARLSLIACLCGAALFGGDDLFFVSPMSLNLTISEEELLANDPGATVITSYTDPLSGKLSVGHGQVVYTPMPDFWAAGIDFFQYAVDDSTTFEDPITVFLVADDGEIQFSEDFEDATLDPAWYLIDEGSTLWLSSDNPIEGQWSLEIDLNLQMPGYESNKKPADPRPDGKIGQGLDPDPNFTGFSGNFVVMRGVTLAQAPVFEVSLISVGGDPQLCARAWQNDGSVVSAPCAGIPHQPVKVYLVWGRMPTSVVRDAGIMFLLVDGRLVAHTKNLDNSGLFPAYWQFGLVEADSELSGKIQLDTLEIWLDPHR